MPMQGLQQQSQRGATAATEKLDHTPYLVGFVYEDWEAMWPQGTQPHVGGECLRSRSYAMGVCVIQCVI